MVRRRGDGVARKYRGRRKAKLVPKSWYVWGPPEPAPLHNHLVGLPCVDCKTPIWSGDPHFSINGEGYVKDARGRSLRRKQIFPVCPACVELRTSYHKARGGWPGVSDPYEFGTIDWASREVEDVLVRMPVEGDE